MPLEDEGDRGTRGGDGATTIPFHEMPDGLKVAYIRGVTGWKTIIGRSFRRPVACHLCPACSHDAGFCMIVADGMIPYELCALHVLRGSQRKESPGLRVDRWDDAVPT